MSTPDPSILDGIARFMDSPRLRQRRMDTIPLRGPGAASTRVQGRQPGDSTTPAELSDLISSIATIGVLQPVLAEEITHPDGPPQLLLVTGERRLRACRWGAAHLPDNPHFEALPAIICPGPLSEEERRMWQIVENLAREPLRPGEQAAALLWHRCAVLTGQLLRTGKPVPADVNDLQDPIQRWEALERIRGRDQSCAAPWSEVLNRLGLQLSPRKARELVAAFRALPVAVSEEMDEAKIRLHTRIRFARLRAGRADAADQIWAAVKDARRTDLLPSAVQAASEDPDLAADEAIEQAQARRQEANEARSHALSRPSTGIAEELARTDQPVVPDPVPLPGQDTANGESEGPHISQGASPTPPSSDSGAEIDATACLEHLRSLLTDLRSGNTLQRYTRGSLRLLLCELHPYVNDDEQEGQG